MIDQYTNQLIHSTSPYLLQHAHNPVNWYPWSKEAFDEANNRNVPIILSIGYSSCHWCHVMERESFENEEVAKVMNDNFVCIKVDREERPDIDQIYMQAIQTMGLQGGWPLNVFITPDQKPFYGGTYFPPAQWKQICSGVSKAFQNNTQQLLESAEQFSLEVNRSELSKYGIEVSQSEPNFSILKKMADILKSKFDPEYGGMNRAPKFPMPGIWKFLLYGNSFLKDKEVKIYLENTLDKMAKGGIYDQIGGGFARYSVDEQWFAPHFEKMLYDNGQLISLYADAYKTYPKKLYKDVVYDTIRFVERELRHENGGFYSAFDADSEGKEGEFYVWQSDELKQILGSDYETFAEYYQVKEDGNWEGDKNILHLDSNKAEIVKKMDLDESGFDRKVEEWKGMLLTVRNQRIKPGLDNKVLSGWNGLMLKGLTDAYRTFGEKSFLDLALANARFLETEMIENNELKRTFGNDDIKACLEDYAFVIDGLIGLYQCTFDEKWIELAKGLAEKTIKLFFDSGEELFYYTSSNSEKLIARKKEIFDNVIPGSNSQMAINLFLLSRVFYDDKLEDLSKKMLGKVANMMETQPSYLYNWATLYFYHSVDLAEISLIGSDNNKMALEIDQQPIYHKIISASDGKSGLPVLASREMVNDKNTLYVCYNKSCKLPVHTVKEALKQINFEPDRP